MISFKILSEDNEAALTEELGAALGDSEYVADVVSSFLEISREGAEIALTNSHGCLLVRIFDGGRYSFVYPIDVAEGASPTGALAELVAYSVRELIPVYLTDTPREAIFDIQSRYPHVEARAYDEDVDSFAVAIYSELDLLDEVPTEEEDGIILSPLTDTDAPLYAALCRNDAVGRYWGYDYREDGITDDAHFLAEAKGELARGVALSLAIREKPRDELIGEAVLFDLDYVGGAMAAIRLFPEVQGRGVGTRALTALIRIARSLGLKTLRAEVMTENTPSIKMTEKQMPRVADKDGRAQFVLELK